MEIKIETKHTITLLYILSWIIFVGVCIEAGGIIFNSLYTLFFNPAIAAHHWPGVDLSGVYRYDVGHFAVETLIMSIVAVLKAVIFYLIVEILHDKKLDMFQPFSRDMQRFIFRICYLALLTGLFSFYGSKYGEWLVSQGVNMPEASRLGLGGADVWLFMSAVLFVIGHIFKRGVEIQTENDLTI